MAAARRRRHESEPGDPCVLYLVESLESDGEPMFGLTHYDRHEIEIYAGQEFGELCHTLIHELMHTFGGDDHTDDLTRLAEELFIRRSEARAWSILTEMGLRVPDLPHGFTELRARAIAAQKETA